MGSAVNSTSDFNLKPFSSVSIRRKLVLASIAFQELHLQQQR
jgi:hypothetical protein